MADAQKVLNLENLIKGYLADMANLREKLRAQKEMLKSTIEGDKDYSEAAAKTAEIKKKENEIKQKLVKVDAVIGTKMQIEKISTELKNVQLSLSDYLNEYADITRSTEFIGPEGELLQIVRNAKLVNKKV
ncbi:MAG: hypothetical protein WCJ70_03285 [bacterium]